MLTATSQQSHTHPLSIVDTTLREGEQFLHARFTSEQRLALARRLDAFGVDVIETPSPRVSPQTARDVAAIASLGLRARVAAHVRCADEDVAAALAAGVDAVHLFYGASPQLRRYSHGRDVAAIAAAATRQIEAVRQAGRYARFSAEDAFRTDLGDLTTIFDAAIVAGAQCIGAPDTVGAATPALVGERIALLRARYPEVEIEFHGHNDTGCAVANAFAALEAGANRIDVTVLGIGERNGITALSGLVAALYTWRRAALAPYTLTLLPELDRSVATMLSLAVPFNSPITSETAFAHRAGVHTNAVLRSPSAYEALDPQAFGLTRHIDTTSRVAGRHALLARAADLGLTLDEAQAQLAAEIIKVQADLETLSQAQVDDILRAVNELNPAPLASTASEGATLATDAAR
jgi:homocitrate synthase